MFIILSNGIIWFKAKVIFMNVQSLNFALWILEFKLAKFEVARAVLRVRNKNQIYCYHYLDNVLMKL